MGSEFRKNVITLIPRAGLLLKKFGELSFEEIKQLTTNLTPEEYARMHMKHLMLEYGNEARLVNQFWERKHKK